MHVSRDFEQVYRSQADPWNIKDASSPRYQRYFELFSPHATGSVLDVGCGFGAFTARFKDIAQSLDGVELSKTAIEKGRQRFPFINFHQGSAANLTAVEGVNRRKFDLIICSDVVCYLKDREKHGLLSWLSEHVSDTGVVVFAGWSPGGKYLTHAEMIRISQPYLSYVHHEWFSDSEHLVLMGRRNDTCVAITIQCGPQAPMNGAVRDWEHEVFQEQEKLSALFARNGLRATFFAEMGAYFWLLKHQPGLAPRMEAVWRNTLLQGHDVELSLDPSWLAESGAGGWSAWLAKAAPEELPALIGRSKQALEQAIRPVHDSYRVQCFRTREARPFERISQALAANGILVDSSLDTHALESARGIEQSRAVGHWQAYFADGFDPRLEAVEAEASILELPVTCFESKRPWTINGAEAGQFAKQLGTYQKELRTQPTVTQQRFTAKCKVSLKRIGFPDLMTSLKLNKVMPKAVARLYENDAKMISQRYLVATGHTSGANDQAALEQQLKQLMMEPRVSFLTLGEMAKKARLELQKAPSEADRAIAAVLRGEAESTVEMEPRQAAYLRERIPLDVDAILDLGCGVGTGTAAIAAQFPWASVVGFHEPSSPQAQSESGLENLRFESGEFTKLPFADHSFSCVYVNEALAWVADLDGTLSEIRRVLRPFGSLVGALPLEACQRNGLSAGPVWRTNAEQAGQRLVRAGFSNLQARQMDLYREWGISSSVAADDQVLFFRAWNQGPEGFALRRAVSAMNWIYGRIKPDRSNPSEQPFQIIADGYGWCLAYAIALGGLLKREGYKLTWVTMLAEGHPRGRGEKQQDSHEVLEVEIEGKSYVLDPMANSCYPYSVKELLQNPALADAHAFRDERCVARGYELYNTSFWYRLVTKVGRRSNPKWPLVYSKNRH